MTASRRAAMAPALLQALVLLPGTVLVVVPSLIVWASRGTLLAWAPASPADGVFWLGLAVGAVGLALMAWTVRAFARFGRGTPAPWQPPAKLVVRGVYRHVRNPMITGVFCVLAAEALVLRSPGLALWLVFFVAANAVYIPLFEEPGLERRFGEAYRSYRRAVPRWIPRAKPWPGPERG